MSFTVIIPARYASSRLPGKILKDIHGQTMLERVYRGVKKSSARSIIIATDDQRIIDEAQRIGADVCLTSTAHESGTQRLSEVVLQRDIAEESIIVNVQGDEPFLPASCIEQVANLLIEDTQAEMATLCTPLLDKDDIFDRNVVKVITNHKDYAMYFSRAPIPWNRDQWNRDQWSGDEYRNGNESATHIPQQNTYRHIGLYAYRARFIQTYVNYPACSLEQMEKLEQLRALWYGHNIKVAQAIDVPGPGIDSEADLIAAKALVMEQEQG